MHVKQDKSIAFGWLQTTKSVPALSHYGMAFTSDTSTKSIKSSKISETSEKKKRLKCLIFTLILASQRCMDLCACVDSVTPFPCWVQYQAKDNSICFQL